MDHHTLPGEDAGSALRAAGVTLAGSGGRECSTPPGEVGLQFKRVRHPRRRERGALPAPNAPGTGTARLPRSPCLSDLHLRNDVVGIELWCFNVVTATFPRHISSCRTMLEFRMWPEAVCDSLSPGSLQPCYVPCQALAGKANSGAGATSAAGKAVTYMASQGIPLKVGPG